MRIQIEQAANGWIMTGNGKMMVFMHPSHLTKELHKWLEEMPKSSGTSGSMMETENYPDTAYPSQVKITSMGLKSHP